MSRLIPDRSYPLRGWVPPSTTGTGWQCQPCRLDARQRLCAGDQMHEVSHLSRAVAEEVDRLEEARITVAAALVEDDEEGGLGEECRLRFELVENLVDHRFEEVELRTRRMAVDEAVRLHIGDGGQVAVLEGVEKIAHVLDVRLTLRGITHDRGGILERIADVTVPVAPRADQHIERIRGAIV